MNCQQCCAEVDDDPPYTAKPLANDLVQWMDEIGAGCEDEPERNVEHLKSKKEGRKVINETFFLFNHFIYFNVYKFTNCYHYGSGKKK